MAIAAGVPGSPGNPNRGSPDDNPLDTFKAIGALFSPVMLITMIASGGKTPIELLSENKDTIGTIFSEVGGGSNGGYSGF